MVASRILMFHYDVILKFIGSLCPYVSLVCLSGHSGLFCQVSRPDLLGLKSLVIFVNLVCLKIRWVSRQKFLFFIISRWRNEASALSSTSIASGLGFLKPLALLLLIDCGRFQRNRILWIFLGLEFWIELCWNGLS